MAMYGLSACTKWQTYEKEVILLSLFCLWVLNLLGGMFSERCRKNHSYINVWEDPCQKVLSYFFTFFCKETGGSENLNLISPEQKAVPLGLLLSQHADNFHSHSSEAQLAHQLQAPWLFMWSMISRKISLKLDIVKKKKENHLGKIFFCMLGVKILNLSNQLCWKDQRIILFTNTFMQMNYISQMSTCIDKILNSRIWV